jgi:hypothetical protein
MLKPSSRAIAFYFIVLTGCGGGGATVRLDPHHPASPNGPEAVPMSRPVALIPDEFDRAVAGATTGVPTEHSNTTPATDHHARTHSHHTSTAQGSTPAAGSADSTAGRADEAETVVFVCPMHPAVTDTTASKCPKCGMRLVPKEE